ncbi:hypothetical protein U1Q18_019862 [Sarracenia purpurea var. burkii]
MQWNPVQPTPTTEDVGAESFKLNISRVNGSVAIDTGIVQATVTQTVFDENHVAIFGVSKVLLPKEIIGKNPTSTSKAGSDIAGGAQPPEVSESPENSPKLYGPPGSYFHLHMENNPNRSGPGHTNGLRPDKEVWAWTYGDPTSGC